MGEPVTTATERPETLDAFRGDRVYLGADHRRNERRTWIVTVICAGTLVALLAGGLATRSMALTANAVHLGAHVAALLVAAGAYALARRHADNPLFAFGTGKLGYLAGFGNAVVLGVTAVVVAAESIGRMFSRDEVDYDAALPLAAAGLVVNLVCIWLLRPTGAHAHRHDSVGDVNLSAVHLHLTADAAVSALAVVAVLLGRLLNWTLADPLAGLLAAGLVAQFALSLLRRAGAPLLDINPSPELTAEVRRRLCAEGETVVDLHLWRLGPGHHAAIAVVAADHPQPAEAFHTRLRGLAGLSHVTVEVRSRDDPDHQHSHG